MTATKLYDAIVLAGGTGRRLGGADKPGIVVGGRTLLDRVLVACDGATTTVVVGPERPTYRPVVWTREEPVGGGPVAALAAGLELITADNVVLLAADLPFVNRSLVDLLGSMSKAVAVTDKRPQWLCGGWSTASLRAALVEVQVDGARLQDVLGPLRPAWLSELGPQGDRPERWFDVDTPEDLARVRSWT